REPWLADDGPPLPKIDSLLNLAKALQPIVVKEIPAARQREEAPRAPERPEAAPAPMAVAPAATGKSRWLRTASASVLGILLLAALGARNTDTIAGLACERLGMHCVPREVVTGLSLPAAPPPAEQPAETARATTPPAQTDEPTQTASIPGPPEPESAAAEPAPVAVPAATQAPYVDEVVWRFLKDTRSSDQLRSFVSQFPASAYRIPAQTRLAAIEPKVTECDLLAAHPLDQLKNPEVTGVSLQFLNSILATRACERAV